MHKTIVRTLLIYVILLVAGAILIGTVSAQRDSRGDYGSDPFDILDKVADEANDEYQIQETRLDGVTDKQGGYQRSYKITNTLDYIRNNIAPYIQRAVFVGLAIAVILLIYNGFLMVTNATHDQGKRADIKKNIMNIVIGVLLLTGFYAVIKIVLALLTSIFGTNGGF